MVSSRDKRARRTTVNPVNPLKLNIHIKSICSIHLHSFIVYFVCLYSKTQIQRPWYRENDTKAQNDEAKEAYEALMTVTLRKPDSDEYKIFSEEVKKRAKQAHGNLVYGEEEVSTAQQTQNICITFIQRRPNGEDVGPTLYKCYTECFVFVGMLSKVKNSKCLLEK